MISTPLKTRLGSRGIFLIESLQKRRWFTPIQNKYRFISLNTILNNSLREASFVCKELRYRKP